jgi:hypothetical protein
MLTSCRTSSISREIQTDGILRHPNQEGNHMSLEHAARRAAQQSFFVAFALDQHQQAQGIDDLQLVGELGCTLEDLTRIRLCRMPQAGQFDEEVAKLATRFHADAALLADILRPFSAS